MMIDGRTIIRVGKRQNRLPSNTAVLSYSQTFITLKLSQQTLTTCISSKEVLLLRNSLIPSRITKPTDFNDLHILEGSSAVKKQLNSVISSSEWPEPKPMSALKKDLY